jgi:hypothetical protein
LDKAFPILVKKMNLKDLYTLSQTCKTWNAIVRERIDFLGIKLSINPRAYVRSSSRDYSNELAELKKMLTEQKKVELDMEAFKVKVKVLKNT